MYVYMYIYIYVYVCLYVLRNLCHGWKKGRCTAGDGCRHAHGIEELRQHRNYRRKHRGPSDIAAVVGVTPASSLPPDAVPGGGIAAPSPKLIPPLTEAGRSVSPATSRADSTGSRSTCTFIHVKMPGSPSLHRGHPTEAGDHNLQHPSLDTRSCCSSSGLPTMDGCLFPEPQSDAEVASHMPLTKVTAEEVTPPLPEVHLSLPVHLQRPFPRHASAALETSAKKPLAEGPQGCLHVPVKGPAASVLPLGAPRLPRRKGAPPKLQASLVQQPLQQQPQLTDWFDDVLRAPETEGQQQQQRQQQQFAEWASDLLRALDFKEQQQQQDSRVYRDHRGLRRGESEYREESCVPRVLLYAPSDEGGVSAGRELPLQLGGEMEVDGVQDLMLQSLDYQVFLHETCTNSPSRPKQDMQPQQQQQRQYLSFESPLRKRETLHKLLELFLSQQEVATPTASPLGATCTSSGTCNSNSSSLMLPSLQKIAAPGSDYASSLVRAFQQQQQQQLQEEQQQQQQQQEEGDLFCGGVGSFKDLSGNYQGESSNEQCLPRMSPSPLLLPASKQPYVTDRMTCLQGGPEAHGDDVFLPDGLLGSPEPSGDPTPRPPPAALQPQHPPPPQQMQQRPLHPLHQLLHLQPQLELPDPVPQLQDQELQQKQQGRQQQELLQQQDVQQQRPRGIEGLNEGEDRGGHQQQRVGMREAFLSDLLSDESPRLRSDSPPKDPQQQQPQQELQMPPSPVYSQISSSRPPSPQDLLLRALLSPHSQFYGGEPPPESLLSPYSCIDNPTVHREQQQQRPHGQLFVPCRQQQQQPQQQQVLLQRASKNRLIETDMRSYALRRAPCGLRSSPQQQ